jgi:hypothetical protein
LPLLTPLTNACFVSVLLFFCHSDGTWYFNQQDMQQDIYLLTRPDVEGNVTFNFTAVTKEDGTEASDSAVFTAQVQMDKNGNGQDIISPLAPIVIFGNSTGLEDNFAVLNVSLVNNPNETTNPIRSLVIHSLNPNLIIEGAIFNVKTGNWVMSEQALESGQVRIKAPADFAGSYEIEIEALATNAFFETTSTGIETISVFWEPVGDGPIITATAVSEADGSASLFEDTNFTLNASFTLRDKDGSEKIGEWIIIEFGADFNLWWSYEFTGTLFQFFGPFEIDGRTITNGINISIAMLDQLTIFPFPNWHGEIPITIFGFTTEVMDPSIMAWERAEFTFQVQAVADPATMMVQTITVPEFNRTSIANLLSAKLQDNVMVNGGERLSVKFINLPLGSQFFLPNSNVRYGGYVEPGVYSIPDASRLPELEFVGPEYVSGTFNVTLSAVTVETSNLDEFLTEAFFNLVIESTPSPFLLLSNDINVDSSTGVEPLVLNVRLLDNQGFLAGEIPPEVIQLFFDLSTTPTDSVFLQPTLGGQLKNTGDGLWTFVGTEKQANAINIVNVNQTGSFSMGILGRTMDDGNVGPLSTDDFDAQVTFATPATPGESITIVGNLYNGTDGNDFYRTTPGSDQVVMGNDGSDIFVSSSGVKTMTGGTGADQFAWPDSVSVAGVDIITDFNAAEGDQLNVGGLINFDAQLDDPSNFVRLTGSILELSPNGDGILWTPVVQLLGVTSLDPDDWYVSGNLLL